MLLLQLGFSSNQPPAKKKKKAVQREAESKSIIWKRNRKRQDFWKWAASVKELWLLIKDLVKNEIMTLHVVTLPQESGIGDHCMSFDAQPSSWGELRTTKGPLCTNTASRLGRQRRTQAKLMEPDLWSRLACTTAERGEDLIFRTVHALAKMARHYSDFE